MREIQQKSDITTHKEPRSQGQASPANEIHAPLARQQPKWLHASGSINHANVSDYGNLHLAEDRSSSISGSRWLVAFDLVPRYGVERQ